MGDSGVEYYFSFISSELGKDGSVYFGRNSNEVPVVIKKYKDTKRSEAEFFVLGQVKHFGFSPQPVEHIRKKNGSYVVMEDLRASGYHSLANVKLK